MCRWQSSVVEVAVTVAVGVPRVVRGQADPDRGNRQAPKPKADPTPLSVAGVGSPVSLPRLAAACRRADGYATVTVTFP
jgi:hypothetical protein